MPQFHFDLYCFFNFLDRIFFLNCFRIPSRSRSSFLFSQWKFFELYVRTCPALFFISSSRFLLRPYDVTTTSNLLFVHLFMQFHLKCVRDFIFVERVFFYSIAWFNFWSHLTYLTHKNDFELWNWLTLNFEISHSLWNWLLFTLIQRDKVKWVCVTLNEGY